MENSMEAFQKTENGITTGYGDTTFGHISEGM
jgi:hypothetical protein